MCTLLITCCSHDLEATGILLVVTDGMSDSVRSTTAAPRLPVRPMADEETVVVFPQCVCRVGPCITLDCAAGWILQWYCHGEC